MFSLRSAWILGFLLVGGPGNRRARGDGPGSGARTVGASPAERVGTRTHTAALDASLAYRPFWLDSARDGWVAAGVSDPNGASGTFRGHQLEGAVRVGILPGMLTLELGGAWLARGGFAKTAQAGREESPLFTYAQLAITGDGP
jgi:hypothetical protein